MKYFLIFALLIAIAYCKTEEENHKEEHHKEKKEEKKKAHHHKWEYTGEYGKDHWDEYFKDCGGKRQSPINIERRKCHYKKGLDTIFLKRESKINATGLLYLYNDGHKIGLHLDKQLKYEVEGGNIGGDYQTAGVHFHWGKSDKVGSEHAIDGFYYPLEMHIVNYDTSRFPTVKEALQSSDGIAVLGVMFEISNYDNPELEKILKLFEAVKYPNSEKQVSVSNLDLADLLPTIQSDSYFRYMGSLTTPGCFEAVIWTVFENPVKISERQMNVFRSFRSGNTNSTEEANAIVDNFRDVQPLNKRKVYWSILKPEKVKTIYKTKYIKSGSNNMKMEFSTLFFFSIFSVCFRMVINI